MAKQSKNYEPELGKKIVNLVLEEGHTLKNINEEYSLSCIVGKKFLKLLN